MVAEEVPNPNSLIFTGTGILEYDKVPKIPLFVFQNLLLLSSPEVNPDIDYSSKIGLLRSLIRTQIGYGVRV